MKITLTVEFDALSHSWSSVSNEDCNIAIQESGKIISRYFRTVTFRSPFMEEYILDGHPNLILQKEFDYIDNKTNVRLHDYGAKCS